MTDIERINSVKSRKPLALIDIVIIALVVIVAVLLTVLPLLSREKGESVVITVDGKESSYSLKKDETLTIKNLTVVIKDGKVKVSESDCADELCVKMGAIDSVGQGIVCLPQGVVITIKGESKFQADTGEEV